MIRSVVLPAIASVVCTSLVLAIMGISEAQVMSSTNYQIQSDSINVGGNETGSSTNYNLLSTIGEIGTGESDSSSYAIGAGYRQMQAIYMSLTGVTNITLSPSIPGVTGGTANGSTTLTVITDSPSGYALTIEAENDPAMNKGSDSVADYSPGGSPSFNFTTNGGDFHFGYSPEGNDIISRFKDNGGGDCDTGGSFDTPLACWDGLTTTGQTISSRTTPNHPDGSTTTVRFRVGVGESVNPAPGFYVATATVTALPL